MERLLEREDELSKIEELLDSAQDGRGGALYLEGEAGIGKSSLLSRAQASARELGLRPLRSSGSPLAQGVAYATTRELLLGEVDAAGEEIWRGAAELAKPALLDVEGKAGPPSPETTLAVRQALVWLVSAIAERDAPLLIVADDLHWTDTASVRFLTAVAARVEDLPVAILAAARPAPAWADRGLAAEVSGAMPVARPARLSEAAVAQALAQILGAEPAPEFAAEAHAQTAGTPYLVEALAGALARRGIEPTAANAAAIAEQGLGEVADEIVRRVRDLDPEAQAIVRAVAITGDGRPAAEAEQVAQLPSGTALGCSESLEAAGLLRGWPEPAFDHPLVRAAVLEDLGPAGRAELHAHAAELALQAGETARAAAHLDETPGAGDPKRAQVLLEVGGRALRSGAPDVAIRHLSRALLEPPPDPMRGPILFELGLAEHDAGDPGAPDRLKAAADAMDDPEMKMRALVISGHALAFQGHWDGGLRRMEEAVAAGAGSDPVAHTITRLERAAFMLTCIPAGREARHLLAELDREVPDDAPVRPFVDGGLALAASTDSTPRDQVIELVRRSQRSLPPELGGIPLAAIPLLALAFAGGYEEVDVAYQGIIAGARRRLDLNSVRIVSGWLAVARHLQGRLHAAEEAALGVVELPGRPATLPDLLAATVRAEVALERGDVAAAAREVDQPLELEPGLEVIGQIDGFIVARARVRLAQGDPAAAVQLAAEAGARQDRWGSVSTGYAQWRLVLAQAEAAAGRRERARELIEAELEEARVKDVPRTVATTMRAHAAISSDTPADAERTLRDALDVLEGEPLDLHRAGVEADLGTVLLQTGRDEEGKDLLRSALEGAWSAGADALAERARSDLRRAGARPRRPARSGIQSLTASEARTARLAAGGMSNREIAESLFVTEKTVEAHLTASYRKLGIGGRGELAAALGEEQSALIT